MDTDISITSSLISKTSKSNELFRTTLHSHLADLVIPGDIIPAETGYIKGHGVYEKDGRLYANYCGILRRVNKLIYVSPLKSRYSGHSGDIIVGRVEELSNGKWAVEIGAGQKAQLSIHSINLPGSVHRKRLDEDYLEMRKYFIEGDIVCCEVQRVQENIIFLQTRTARYGNLENGCLIKVSPCLIQKQNKHIIDLPFDVQVILGNNGYIWISSITSNDLSKDTLNFSSNQAKYSKVESSTRWKIARVRNCIYALSSKWFLINPDIISLAYSTSIDLSLSVTDLLKHDIIETLLQFIYEHKSS